MKRLILAISMLLAPALAQAATCTVNAGDTLWTTVGQDIASDCTETNADNFVIPAGAKLTVGSTIASPITITTGDITITGGTLSVPCGYALKFGSRLHLKSGKLEVRGCVRSEQRLVGITWGAASATATLETAASAVATANTDWLVYGDDDPENAAATVSGPVQIGAGPPTQGTYRPSFNKWSWYDIHTVSGQTVSYYYDSLTGRGGAYTGTGTPFEGTRVAALTTPTAVTSITRGLYGHTSDIATSAFGTFVRSDLGSQYVTVTNGACAGRRAKIIDVVDAGATETITVAGDLSSCGATPEVVIDFGARAGDKVYVVTPAVLDGADTGAIVLAGGTFEISWARLTRLGFQGRTVAPFDGTISPTLARHCNVCIVQESDSVSPSSSSFLVRSEISYPTTTTSDTSTVGLLSMNNGQTALRYSSLLNVSGIKFDRLHIRDGLNNATGGAGTHGFYIDGVTGLILTRTKIERLSDDGYGENVKSFSNPANRNAITLRQVISWEQMASTNNSQECFEPADLTDGTGDTSALVINAGARTYTDILATGCKQSAFKQNATGDLMERIVAGSVQLTATSQVGNTTGMTGAPANMLDNYINTLRDSVFFLTTASTATDRVILNAKTSGTLVVATPGTGTGAFVRVGRETKKTAVFTGTGGGCFSGSNADASARYSVQTVFEDVACIGGTNSTYFGLAWAQAGGGTLDLLLRRVFMGMHTVTSTGGLGRFYWEDTAAACPGSNCPVKLTIDGLVVAPTTPTTNTVGMGSVGVANTSTLINACAASNTWPGTAAGHFGSYGASATNAILTRSLRPVTTDAGVLRNLVADPSNPDPCEQMKPRELGLQSFGVAHSMLGDFVLSQVALWSDKNLIQPRTGGAIPKAF